MFPDDQFFDAHFIYDGPQNPGHGAAIVIYYCNVDTKNPLFNYSVQLTHGSKIEIYE